MKNAEPSKADGDFKRIVKEYGYIKSEDIGHFSTDGGVATEGVATENNYKKTGKGKQ